MHASTTGRAAWMTLRARGFTIAALTPREPSVTLAAFAASPRPSRVALLVGTEGDGLTADAEAAADVRVRIPIAPAVDSLNLAVAVGIALHQLSASRTARPLRSPRTTITAVFVCASFVRR